ncbi:MAG: trypsin-like peptidase domain-containing protein [Anaerolineae bacterium]
MNSKRAWLAVALLLCGIGGIKAQQTGLDLDRIERATVFIMQASQTTGAPVITCVSSGTLVSRSGLILTNAHSTVTNTNCPGDLLIVSISVRPDEAPIPLYQADIVQADEGLDLALIRIARQNDGRLIDTASLSLPFVELADSDTLRLDSTISVIGYPGFGDQAIEEVRGTILGFTAEPSGGSRSWLKTSAGIPGTMSGGGAYNQNGELVGIPTTAPISLDNPDATCLILQDTNGDGLANTSDSCVPIGGQINSLRPSNFARALIRAASLDLRVDFLSTQAPTSSGTTAVPRFERVFFAPAVNEAGMPTTAIRSLPSGSTSLYLFFDYHNMTAQTIYELRVNVDGAPYSAFGLPPVRWSGGRDGLWYVGSTGQPLPDGIYDFTLLINGVISESARLLVGRADPAPQFSDIVFGIEDLRGNIAGNGYVLPVASTVSARFIYRNMTPENVWTAIWYRDGSEITGSRVQEDWTESAEGTRTIRIQSPSGLLPGSYRLDLYIDDRLAATSDLTLAGAQDGRYARIFANLHFTTADTATEARSAAAITSFSAGTGSLYALFDWQQIAPGTLWTLSWYVDDGLFFQQTTPWNAADAGEDFIVRLSSRQGMPDGSYRLEITLNNLLFASQTARVGIGQLAIDRFANATGVQMRGQIRDALTGEGIPGASIFIITENFSADDFMAAWRQDQLYATAITDRTGRFELNRLLQPEVDYSLAIVADGYLPITADGVAVTLDDNPAEVQVEMTRG